MEQNIHLHALKMTGPFHEWTNQHWVFRGSIHHSQYYYLNNYYRCVDVKRRLPAHDTAFKLYKDEGWNIKNGMPIFKLFGRNLPGPRIFNLHSIKICVTTCVDIKSRLPAHDAALKFYKDWCSIFKNDMPIFKLFLSHWKIQTF